MRSDYYRKLILDKSDKQEEASRKKWADRGTTGWDMGQKEVEDSVRDWAKDNKLIDEYGKDAPKGRGFGPKREGGGIARDRRAGMAMGGRTRVPRVDDSKVLMQAGGYWGGDTESGRGTMAGELAPKGSMSVREAGEDMYELSKRRRGMQGGGAASSYNRPYNNQNK